MTGGCLGRARTQPRGTTQAGHSRLAALDCSSASSFDSSSRRAANAVMRATSASHAAWSGLTALRTSASTALT
eukprot:362220-Chlamydomonas_euryale.AAC.14